MAGSQIGFVVFLCEIEKKMKDAGRKGWNLSVSVRTEGNVLPLSLSVRSVWTLDMVMVVFFYLLRARRTALVLSDFSADDR